MNAKQNMKTKKLKQQSRKRSRTTSRRVKKWKNRRKFNKIEFEVKKTDSRLRRKNAKEHERGETEKQILLNSNRQFKLKNSRRNTRIDEEYEEKR